MNDAVETLLQRLRAGEAGARDALFAAAYDDLRQLARARLREGGRGTVLETTALVHETWLRLSGHDALQPEHRHAFFAYAAQAMRSVIVDEVRARGRIKRGGDLVRVTLDTGLGERLPAETGDDLLRLDEALTRLATLEPRAARVVEMRYFGALPEQQIAEALGLTERTVRRDWDKARRLLVELMRAD